MNKANREAPLATRKRPGSAPKLDEKSVKLFEEGYKEALYATLQERHDYIHAL